MLYEAEIEDVGVKRLSLGELESERNAREAALSIIRADPRGWLWQRIRNAAYLWLNLQWDPDILETGPIVLFAAISVSLIYYLLLVGGLLGSLSLWLSSRESRQRVFVVVAWLYMAAATPTVLTFVGNFIPYVGSLIALVLPVLLALLELEPPW